MRSLVGDLVLVRLQEERDPLLHKRLYNALRRAILDGSLAPQSRLPPSRDLAGELGVSRNTILTTYEQLLAEDMWFPVGEAEHSLPKPLLIAH